MIENPAKCTGDHIVDNVLFQSGDPHYCDTYSITYLLTALDNQRDRKPKNV